MTPPQEWALGSGSVDPTPWPGPSSAGAASGIAQLTHPGTGDVARGAWTNVAAWRGAQASPVSVLVGTSREAMTQGRGGATEVTGVVSLGGILRFTFGLGAALRTVEADLRAGSYQLPPCDYCTLDAMLWKRSAAPIQAQVNGAIVPGFLPNPSRLTNTVQLTIFQAESYTDAVPAGARWVALGGGNPTGIGGAGPILSYRQGAAGLYLRHDYAAGVFLGQPGVPTELLNTAAWVVANEGPVSVDVTLRFFLEV